jgi:glycosyltransferase involved in cell wall biosynthesis
MLIMKTSLVSIIIPTFNSEKFILEAIQSVQNQTYENWELF